MLSNIKANVKRSTDNSLNGLQEQRLNELNEKLSRLNKLPQREVEEKHDLQNAIIRLLENDIKEFKLFILKKYNFYIEFSLQADEIIHMKFTPFKEFKEYFELDAFQMRTLEHIGFSVNEDMVFIDFDLKNNSVNSLLILVSRIFFEVFYSHRREIFELVIY